LIASWALFKFISPSIIKVLVSGQKKEFNWP
jgi:hypothetical protein